ncbi:anti-phage protein KwaA [Xanthomonas sp. NCPPB 1325]|uniref:anti-phage protein KwaA n=1 Tax=Xanthomonas sp. NCPPB 1325 TaxID=487529 RepID=UPI0035564D77
MNKNKTLEKFELYILSLWLLFLLIIVVTIDVPFCFKPACSFIGAKALLARNVVPAVAFLLITLGALYYFRFNYKIAGSKSIPVEVSCVEDINYEHLTFLTTYIIPLICFNLTSGRYLFALGILLIVIGIIYVRTDKFYANPTLAVLGFRLYSVKLTRRTGEELKITLITKDQIRNGDKVRFLELDDRVYYARGSR